MGGRQSCCRKKAMCVCQSCCRDKEERTDVQQHLLETIPPTSEDYLQRHGRMEMPGKIITALEDNRQRQGRPEVPEEIILPSKDDMQRQGLPEVPEEIIPALEDNRQRLGRPEVPEDIIPASEHDRQRQRRLKVPEVIIPALEDDGQRQGRPEVPEDIIPASEDDRQRQRRPEVPEEIIQASDDQEKKTQASEDESYNRQNIEETDKVSATIASKTDNISLMSAPETVTTSTMPALQTGKASEMSALETDSTSPMSALRKIHKVLVDCLDPDPVLDKLLEIGFPLTTIRDIREERITSEKNRKLIEAVRKRGYEGYCNFKSSLKQCRQELLYTLLERTEKGEDTLDLQRELCEKALEQTKLESNDKHLYTEFKEELVRLYNEKESMIPASPLVEDHAVPLIKLYVQPPMSAFIKPNAFGHEQKSPDKTTVSSYHKLFLNDDNVPYKNIYVEANAGYGKTSFTQKVAITWCLAQNRNESKISKQLQEDVDTLKRFDLLFLLHLRDFQGDDMCLLDDLILKFVSKNLPSKERFSIEFIGRMLQNQTCLVILDGLDEWVHPETCPQTPGIPHNNYRERCTQLTTTRPWKLSTIGLTPNLIDRHIEISTLDEETSKDLKSNAVKLLSENRDEKERDVTDFDRKVSSVKLGDIRLIPYILLQLVCIWFDGLSIGKSKCETYSNTIESTLQRGLNKKNAPTLPTGNAEHVITVPECMRHNEFCKQYMNLLLKLGKLAFYALFQKIKESSLVIDSTTVLKFLTEQELEFCLKIGLLSQSKDRSKVSVKRYQVFFQHKSVQEFLAALYITSEWNNGTIKSNILEVCSSLSSILEMENLFVFVCGMNSEVYTCISGELQTIVDLDSSVRQFRTYMYIDRDDAWKSMKSYQSMQLECLQESLRNGNDSCPIPLYFVLDKHSLTYDVKALKSIMQVNESIGKSPQVSLNEKIVASMLSEDPPFVFMQSLDPGVFTSLETLRVEDCDKEPVWLTDILTESARTLKCLTLSGRYREISLSAISIMALTGLTCLQSLYLALVDMTHSNLKCLYAYIIQTTTLTQLKLEGINCLDHRGLYRDCDVTLDLHRLKELKMLHLDVVPCIELRVNTSCLEKLEFRPPLFKKMTARASATLWQDLRAAPVLSSLMLSRMSSCQEMIQTIPTLTRLQYLELEGIDMDDVIPRVSPAMTQLKHVVLLGVKMSSAAFREFLLSVVQLQHPVTVELSSCKGPSEEEWRAIVNVIKTTLTLPLLQDLSIYDWGSASLTLKNKTV